MHVVMYTKCPGLSGELQTAMDKKQVVAFRNSSWREHWRIIFGDSNSAFNAVLYCT